MQPVADRLGDDQRQRLGLSPVGQYFLVALQKADAYAKRSLIKSLECFDLSKLSFCERSIHQYHARTAHTPVKKGGDK